MNGCLPDAFHQTLLSGPDKHVFSITTSVPKSILPDICIAHTAMMFRKSLRTWEPPSPWHRIGSASCAFSFVQDVYFLLNKHVSLIGAVAFKVVNQSCGTGQSLNCLCAWVYTVPYILYVFIIEA